MTLSPLTAIRDIEQLARTLQEGVADFATLPRRAELLSPLSPAHGRLLMDVIYHKLATGADDAQQSDTSGGTTTPARQLGPLWIPDGIPHYDELAMHGRNFPVGRSGERRKLGQAPAVRDKS